ncbi:MULTISPECIES: hypothetical protein [unclassified Nocardia]|uniref:hypothetical protein n=1 Tax=unclassified Nocardia TaxID=2637762 RepID=UPI001CE4A376|nr:MULTISPECIES: hypothetical protein [unclassified Nocardia]
MRFNEDERHIVLVTEGCSFLGFDIRRKVDRQGVGKLVITPSKECAARLRKRLTSEVRNMQGSNASAVIFPLCGELIMHADHEPQSPHEWERWFRTFRRVLRKRHIVGQVDCRGRKFCRFLRAHCQRRIAAAVEHRH